MNIEDRSLFNSKNVVDRGRTVIIGGGLAGVTSLYELSRRGTPAVLLEARDGVGLETSFANGAMLTPSMPDPWNSPGVGKHLLSSIFASDAALKLHVREIPDLFFWGLRFLRHSTPSMHRMATDAVFALASYSVQRTDDLIDATDLECDYDTRGTLKIFESESAMRRACMVSESLRSAGLNYKNLTPAEAVKLEPLLNDIRSRITGAIYYPDDRVGDAYKFTKRLAAKAIEAGGEIKVGRRAKRICTQGGAVTGIETDQGFIKADRVIICSGYLSPAIAKSAGVSLPIKPVKGYSITFRLNGANAAPKYAVVDDALHAAVVPLGDRLRVVGAAEFAGIDKELPKHRIEKLTALFRRVYPGLADRLNTESIEPWTNFRPMSADGLPFVGEAGRKGLWFNTGHGYLGWTMAAGSAALLADLMENKKPEIDPAPYRVER